MIRAQKRMLQRFEKTNEMLANCNTLSATRLERATRDFKVKGTSDLDPHREKHFGIRFRLAGPIKTASWFISD